MYQTSRIARPRRNMTSSNRTRNKSNAQSARGSGVLRAYAVVNHSAHRNDIGIVWMSEHEEQATLRGEYRVHGHLFSFGNDGRAARNGKRYAAYLSSS